MNRPKNAEHRDPLTMSGYEVAAMLPTAVHGATHYDTSRGACSVCGHVPKLRGFLEVVDGALRCQARRACAVRLARCQVCGWQASPTSRGSLAWRDGVYRCVSTMCGRR